MRRNQSWSCRPSWSFGGESGGHKLIFRAVLGHTHSQLLWQEGGAGVVGRTVVRLRFKLYANHNVRHVGADGIVKQLSPDLAHELLILINVPFTGMTW